MGVRRPIQGIRTKSRPQWARSLRYRCDVDKNVVGTESEEDRRKGLVILSKEEILELEIEIQDIIEIQKELNQMIQAHEAVCACEPGEHGE